MVNNEIEYHSCSDCGKEPAYYSRLAKRLLCDKCHDKFIKAWIAAFFASAIIIVMIILKS